MRILLINSPINFNMKFNPILDTLLPPLGLAYLAAMIEKNHIVKIVDFAKHKFSDDILKILTADFDAIGISATTFSFLNAIALSQKCKGFNSNIRIIIGGPHITSNPESFSTGEFDYAVLGEGEITFEKLIEALDKKEKLDNVDGIIFKDNNRIIKNKPRIYVSNIDDLPLPQRKLIDDFKDYNPTLISARKLPSTQIIASRGCPFHCTFCDKKVFGNNYRHHSVDRIIKEIKTLIDEFNIKDIRFFDDIFTCKKKHILNLCQRIIDENIKITWSCQTRLDFLDEELLDIMKKSGCWQITFGIERFDNTGLKKVNKKLSIDFIRDSIRMIQKFNIETRGYFIVGFPDDTHEYILRSVEQIDKILLESINFFPLMLLPGTEMTEKILLSPDYKSDNCHFIPNTMTKETLIETINKCYKIYFLNFSYILFILKFLLRNPGRIKVYFQSFIFLILFQFNTKSKDKLFNA